jgi:hypothetical protein
LACFLLDLNLLALERTVSAMDSDLGVGPADLDLPLPLRLLVERCSRLGLVRSFFGEEGEDDIYWVSFCLSVCLLKMELFRKNDNEIFGI